MLGLVLASLCLAVAASAEAAEDGSAAQGPSLGVIDDFVANGNRMQLRLLQEELKARAQNPFVAAKLGEVGRALKLLERDGQAERQTPRRRASLQIQNHTPFRVYIYIDKVLMGWVDGDTTFIIRGFIPGYYVLYGRTHFGAASWGPFLLYIPGIHHLW